MEFTYIWSLHIYGVYIYMEFGYMEFTYIWSLDIWSLHIYREFGLRVFGNIECGSMEFGYIEC